MHNGAHGLPLSYVITKNGMACEGSIGLATLSKQVRSCEHSLNKSEQTHKTHFT